MSTAAFVRFMASRQRARRAVDWCLYSYLMRSVPGGFRLTAAGEDALRLAFVAHCEGWPTCPVCHRQKPPAAFAGKRGKPTRTCGTCVDVKQLSGLL
jgi:hypothetical protein